MTYLTQRKIAADCKVCSETVSRVAAKLGLGNPGSAKNSPKTFTPEDALAVATAIFAEKEGDARNRLLTAEAELFNTACRMAQLAGLAGAMGHRATPELQDLAKVIAKIHAGFGETRPDLKETKGKIIFLNSLNPHKSDLISALNAVSTKL
jgi:hypothetical protein